jgi:hypothetical protein
LQSSEEIFLYADAVIDTWTALNVVDFYMMRSIDLVLEEFYLMSDPFDDDSPD